MNISALTKLLFIVAFSAWSGVLVQIHHDGNVIVLDLMVRMPCRKNPLVFDLAVTTWCIFSKDISFFSYVFFLNKDMAVDELAEDQSSDLDLNKVRKLCCAWAPQGHNTMNPKLPSFPTNVSISNSSFQLVCPEASTRKRVWRRRIYRRRRRVGKIRRRTTIGMVGMTKWRRIRRRSGKYDEFNGRCHGG